MPFDPALRHLIANFRRARAWDEELDLRLLRALWPMIVGSALAESTMVERIEGARVVIRVPDQTWEKQLRSIRSRLLRKMNEPWPNAWIRDIGFIHENKRN